MFQEINTNSDNNNQNNNTGYSKPKSNWSPSNNQKNFAVKPNEFVLNKNGEVQLYRAYVATGNKDTPEDVSNRMVRVIKELDIFGYTLRTSAMDGPDGKFESAVSKSELYLPWKDFNNKTSKFYFNTKEALATAKLFHSTFDSLKPAIQAFLAKDARMVLGDKLTSPAMFIICWSADGAESSKQKTNTTGFMSNVLSIATAMKIPVFNFANPDAEQRLKSSLEITSVTNQSNSEI